jgi:hypothetical protein
MQSARERLHKRRLLWGPCWRTIIEYPERKREFRERMAAGRIQRIFRGHKGRQKAKVAYMQRRLVTVRRVSHRQDGGAVRAVSSSCTADWVQMMAVARIEFVFLLFKRRKLLRERQVTQEEKRQLKTRMKKAKAKGSTMAAAALKRHERVSWRPACLRLLRVECC